jgi:hypothetical protein
MDIFERILPLVGVVVGWVLKAGTDLFTERSKERAIRRKCTFYLLRAWKALLDYERAVSFLTSKRPDVNEYEPLRDHFAERFLARIGEDKDCLMAGVEALASIDPTAAAQLDNTIKNIRSALRGGFEEIIKDDPAGYVEAMNSHNSLIDWTLADFQSMAEKLAGKTGLYQKWKVSAWCQSRIDGGKEFKDEIADFEERVNERRAKGPDTSAQSSGK